MISLTKVYSNIVHVNNYKILLYLVKVVAYLLCTDDEDLSIPSDPSFNDILFIFDNFDRRLCFDVTIFLDDVYEDDEVFQLQLADVNSTRLNTTYVTILDASSKSLRYTVSYNY